MGKDQEWFDIFDEARQWIGTAPRPEVHKRGYWHQTFQCWIIDMQGRMEAGEERQEPALLFQMRHPGKDTFPSLLDISCAGHLLAGESVEDGVRELAEELGIEVAFDELRPCGVYKEEQRISPELMDREFCHVFILPWEQPLETYKLQEDEVTGLYRIGLSDVRLIAQGIARHIEVDGVEPDADGRLVPVKRTFNQADFVPHAEAYFHLVIQAVEQLK